MIELTPEQAEGLLSIANRLRWICGKVSGELTDDETSAYIALHEAIRNFRKAEIRTEIRAGTKGAKENTGENIASNPQKRAIR